MNESHPPGPARSRWAIAAAAVLTVTAGLGARYGGLDDWLAKYLGVALWATEAYLVTLFIRPSMTIPRAAAWSLAASWAVELAQLTPGPAWLSSKHLLLRLVFGTTFDAPDLLAYLVGVALGAAADRAIPWRRDDQL